LTLRFCKGQFDDKQESTVDASFLEQSLTIGEQKHTLRLWDTAGQEKYHALNAVYYRGAAGALIVYSVEDLDSFEKLKTWYVELRKYLGDETPIIIAGNKCDLPTYTVPREAGEAYAAEQNVEHKWTSAKTGKGVDDVFRTLTQSK